MTDESRASFEKPAPDDLAHDPSFLAPNVIIGTERDGAEYCPTSADHWHCPCWSECEPCHFCGDDTPDSLCDCDRCAAAREAS